MKYSIGFINFSPLVFDVSTPYERPLGGSESAMCYLAEAMAKRGNKIMLFTSLKKTSTKRGVRCTPMANLPKYANDLDFLVVQNSPLQGYQMKPLLGKKTKLILWSQHDTNQPAVESMNDPSVIAAYDGVVLISDWQRRKYIEDFGVDPKKSTVLRNAISPVFENLFKGSRNTLLKKANPPVLVYTSTPFRGLNLLIQLFPAIRAAVPNVKLKVFSSLKVYNVPEEVDNKNYGNLYQACRDTPGVEYIGSVSQTRLAEEMAKASIFAYPNIFPETGCIAAMEAMAAGCFVVTSRLGALPEAVKTYGKLIKIDDDWQRYGEEFIKVIVKYLKNPRNLIDQVRYSNEHVTWKVRAEEWEKWIKTL